MISVMKIIIIVNIKIKCAGSRKKKTRENTRLSENSNESNDNKVYLKQSQLYRKQVLSKRTAQRFCFPKVKSKNMQKNV